MSVHTLHLIIVFALVATVFTAFLREWASPDLVALSAMGVLLVAGILSADETLAVFSNSAPVVIGCMFVLSAGLERTGAIDSLAHVFMRLAGTNEWRALLALALLIVPLSATVNHLPVVVVFVPVILALARNTDLKASRLLIPLSYFSILGGTCTLIGMKTNLLVNGIAHRRGLPQFGMFEITPLGLIYAAVGVAYLLIFARKLLPYRESLAALIGGGMPRLFLTQAVISNTSPLLGKTIAETPLARLREAKIIMWCATVSGSTRHSIDCALPPAINYCLRRPSPGSRESRQCRACFSHRSELGVATTGEHEAVLMEGILGSRSTFLGKTLRDLNFRKQYGVHILAVHRQGENLREHFEDVELDLAIPSCARPGRGNSSPDAGARLPQSHRADPARLSPAQSAVGDRGAAGASWSSARSTSCRSPPWP